MVFCYIISSVFNLPSSHFVILNFFHSASTSLIVFQFSIVFNSSSSIFQIASFSFVSVSYLSDISSFKDSINFFSSACFCFKINSASQNNFFCKLLSTHHIISLNSELPSYSFFNSAVLSFASLSINQRPSSTDIILSLSFVLIALSTIVFSESENVLSFQKSSFILGNLSSR